MYAVERGCTDIISQLLQKGAQINLPDLTGTTPLILSCKFGRANVMEILLQHGAYINLQNNEGTTALKMSRRKGHTKLVELLMKHGTGVIIDTSIDEIFDVSACKDPNTSDVLGKRASSSTNINTDGSISKMDRILSSLRQNVADLTIISDAFSAAKQFKMDTKPELEDVCARLDNVCDDWHAIGHELGLKNSPKVGTNATDCLRRVIDKWLNRGIPPPTWNSLADALDRIDPYKEIARKIRIRDKSAANTPKLHKVYALLVTICYDWRNIGHELGLKEHVLKKIEYNCGMDAEDCLEKSIRKWLKRGIPPTTWKELYSRRFG